MGKYLDLAKEYVKRYKPAVEASTDTNLGDIVVKEIRALPEYRDRTDLANLDEVMGVGRGYFIKPRYRTPATIYVNEDKYEIDNNASSEDIPANVNHELCHLVHDQLIKNFVCDRLIKNRGKKIKFLLSKIWLKRKNWFNESFREGFSEYMSLIFLRNLYDDQALRKASNRLKFLNSKHEPYEEFNPYKAGYNFFSKVLSNMGKDRVFEVAISPPIGQIEIKYPLLYLLRKYPAKTIKNLPRYIRNNIREK